MDLAINMKAVLVASYFTALSLQVFFASLYLFCEWGKESYEQADPGGNDESYEYVDEKEIDSRKKEERGKDDGDRLVGGKITNTRFTSQHFRERKNLLRKFPFVVGWNQYGMQGQMSCSGENQKISMSVLWIFAI